MSIQAPSNEGSHYYIYKGFHSIVLSALVDVNYNLFMLIVEALCRISDGGIYKNSSLYKATNHSNMLKMPAPKLLPGRNKKIPYCIKCDFINCCLRYKRSICRLFCHSRGYNILDGQKFSSTFLIFLYK